MYPKYYFRGKCDTVYAANQRPPMCALAESGSFDAIATLLRRKGNVDAGPFKVL